MHLLIILSWDTTFLLSELSCALGYPSTLIVLLPNAYASISILLAISCIDATPSLALISLTTLLMVSLSCLWMILTHCMSLSMTSFMMSSFAIFDIVFLSNTYSIILYLKIYLLICHYNNAPIIKCSFLYLFIHFLIHIYLQNYSIYLNLIIQI